jgi:hypothetical protein
MNFYLLAGYSLLALYLPNKRYFKLCVIGR